MTRLAFSFLGVLALSACASSAPYTAAAVALNAGVAASASAAQRAAGGCFATCTNGLVCNPRTGFCEAAPPPGFCRNHRDGAECLPADILIMKRQESPPAGAASLGLSPATGVVPPPPSEASPRSETSATGR